MDLTVDKIREKLAEAVRIPDLEKPAEPEVTPLRINDPRRYFEVRSPLAFLSLSRLFR